MIIGSFCNDKSLIFGFSPKQSMIIYEWLLCVIEDFVDKLFLPANFASPSHSVTSCVLTCRWSLPAARRRLGVQPHKIAEPTQSGWLQRSEGQFWRVDTCVALSDSLMRCLLCVKAASVILEEQRGNVLGRNQTSALATRTSVEVIYQHHTVAGTLEHNDLGVCVAPKSTRRGLSVSSRVLFLYFTAALNQNGSILSKGKGGERCKLCPIQMEKKENSF